MNKILSQGSGRHAVRRPALSIRLAAACAVFLFARLCPAQTPNVVTLTFEGLRDTEEILNYYNGGYGSEGSGPGPNYGITFGSDSLAVISENAGGTGNISGNPSGSTAAFFLSGSGVVMNVAGGFQNGFAFYFSAPYYAGSVTVYDGLNGSGNVLAQIPLPLTQAFCNGSAQDYSCWQQTGVTFSGTAKSVNFGGSANYIVFDNITLGTSIATAPLVITTPSATTTSLPAGAVGVPYNFQPAATGGTPPYTWIASELPSNLAVTNGAISGTPAIAGTYSLSLTVRDSTSPPLSATTQALTLIINPAPPKVTCNPQSGTYAPGAAYSTTCTATGGVAPYTWSFSSLPAWLKSSGTSGATITLSGTVPTPPPTSYSVSVTVADSTAPTKQTASTTVTINLPTLTVSCSPQSGAFTAGASYSATCTASGGTPTYNWTFSGLPSWLNSSATSGATITLSGTVPAPPPASYSATVTVTDSTSPTHQTNSTTVTINVSAAALTAGCNPQSGSYAGGAQYSTNCTATGGTAPYTWSFSGLPSWLKSSGTSGAVVTLSGATSPGSYSVTVTVTDSNVTSKQTASTTVTINVASAPQLSCSPSSGPLMVGIPYSATCTVSGGASPYAFSLSAGSLPSGLTPAAAATTYTISGKPAAPGAYSYTVQVRDSVGQSATQSFSGTISPAPSVGSFSVTAVPSAPNQQTTSLALSSAPPTALSGTLCLTFSANSSVVGAGTYQSQEVVFANGATSAACSSTLKTTLPFTIAAGSATAVWSGNSSQFSTGTVAGTITVTMQSLTDPNGNSVLPSPAPSQTITVAAAAPALSGSPAMTTTSSSITVVFDGATPTRHLTGATYVFNPGAMAVSVSFTSGSFAGLDQSQWFATPASLATGGGFSLSATFPCTNCSAITGVQVTLSN